MKGPGMNRLKKIQLKQLKFSSTFKLAKVGGPTRIAENQITETRVFMKSTTELPKSINYI